MNDPCPTTSAAAIPFLRLCGLGLALVAGAWTVPVQAAPVPSASTRVFCSVEGNSFDNPTECEFGGSRPIPSSASATVTPGPVPSVIATATTPPEGLLGAGASATALYFFRVEGPADGVRIPILMDIYLLSEGTFEAQGIARLSVSTTSGVFRGFEVCSDGFCDETQMSKTIDLEVLSGSTRDSVTLFAQARAFVTRSTKETALAVADPYFYINPTFPDASLYRVAVSPGFGNAPVPVPEPAAFYSLGAGLCLVTWRMRQARRSKRVVAAKSPCV